MVWSARGHPLGHVSEVGLASGPLLAPGCSTPFPYSPLALPPLLTPILLQQVGCGERAPAAVGFPVGVDVSRVRLFSCWCFHLVLF